MRSKYLKYISRIIILNKTVELKGNLMNIKEALNSTEW
jgi:hypothetical protein